MPSTTVAYTPPTLCNLMCACVTYLGSSTSPSCRTEGTMGGGGFPPTVLTWCPRHAYDEVHPHGLLLLCLATIPLNRDGNRPGIIWKQHPVFHGLVSPSVSITLLHQSPLRHAVLNLAMHRKWPLVKYFPHSGKFTRFRCLSLYVLLNIVILQV